MPTPTTSTCGRARPVCRTYSRAYLRHIFREQEILSSMLASYHNLYFLHEMMNGIRESIAADRFAQFRTAFLNRFASGDL